MPIDLERLAGWMDAEGLGRGPITGVERIGGGTQNILLRFWRGPDRFVLRHPPTHKRPDSDETMRREARVLSALADSDVPHPRLIAACGDETVLGSAFYLMEDVAGTNPTVELPPRYRQSAEWRRAFGLSAVDAAAAVGAVDHLAAGLDGLGRPHGYLERQVARWRAQLDSYGDLRGYPGPDIGDVAEIGSWLDANRPTSWRPGLIHGDFHLANLLCAPDRPSVAAVVDWELSTIGDPLVDLGWLLATWPGDDGPSAATAMVRPWDGFPSADDLVERYAERTERDLSAIGWYKVLACYKLGIILEGTYARACAGKAPENTGRALHAAAVALLQRASNVLRSA